MAADQGLTAHWDDAYAQGDVSRSWFQPEPVLSLRMLDAAGVTAAGRLIDVGGGASPLAATLLERGFRDLTVLDISAAGMEYAQRRLGPRAREVTWVAADIRTWVPPRRFAAWHDRAVFHFLTDVRDQQAYLRARAAATAAGAVSVFGCFAPDGPPRCSGLPVARYAPADLAAVLGDTWTLVAQAREAHLTPSGQTQPFAWSALRRLR
jgi:SAM-dependent methyltransferase